ncbi:MAG TPA: hypothetical protein VE944_27535 [Nostoc sp.]|uniref:hypothetical protein n=1 Tax=Nostoc sp. TaxID=1180 RepID=UPI002D7508B1|nr:hypothetical protein [Nostoc sp.]HYX18049.1 hypothetical protein [Nostoc sp.]
MTKTRTKPDVDKSTKRDQSNKARTRSHMTIPTDDLDWALNQSPTVLRLLCECWKSDPYGSRWMPLTTTLRDRNLRGAKKILRDTGLFDFKTETRVLEGKQHYETMVINLHGSRTVYWKQGNNFASGVGNDSANLGNDNAAQGIDSTPIGTKASGVGNDSAGVNLEIITEQAFQNLSVTSQEHLKNSSKEFLRCDSSTPNEISQGEETAIAPLGGASPQLVEGVEELEEELPAVMDCTTLALVDALLCQSTSLSAENEISGVEPKNSPDGVCSVGAKTLTQSEIFDWLDRADVGECPPLWVIQYLLDSKYYANIRASISKFEQQWNVSVVDYRVQQRT